MFASTLRPKVNEYLIAILLGGTVSASAVGIIGIVPTGLLQSVSPFFLAIGGLFVFGFLAICMVKPFWGLLIVLFSIPFYGFIQQVIFHNSSLVAAAKEISIIILSIGYLIHLSVTRRKLTRAKVLIPFLLFSSYVLVRAIFSPNLFLALTDLRFYILYPMVLFVAAGVVDSETKFRIVLKVTLFIAFIVAAYGILQVATNGMVDQALGRVMSESYRARHLYRFGAITAMSTTAGRGELGAYMACLGIVFIGLHKYICKFVPKGLVWIIILSVLAALIFTYSRTSYLMFLVGVITLGFYRRGKAILYIGLIMLLVGGGFFLTMEPATGALHQALTDVGSAFARVFTVWPVALRVSATNPLGIGVGEVGKLPTLPGAGGEFLTFDNAFLSMLVEIGILGLILFLWMLCAIAMYLKRNVRMNVLFSVFIALMVSFLVKCLLGNFLHQIPAIIYFWALFGIGVNSKLSSMRRV